MVVHLVLTDDGVGLRIVDHATVLLAEEHKVRQSQTLDVGEVGVEQSEADEHIHHEVMDDAHAHCAAEQVDSIGEERQVSRGGPEAQTREEHENDQRADSKIAELLGNAELRSQRMGLAEEQVVLDPFDELMAVVRLGQPSLVVKLDNARSAIRRALDEKCQDDAYDNVDEDDEAEEQMDAASDAHEFRPEGEMDAETRNDEENHRDQVHPMGDTERQRMRFLVVCEMRHSTSPPKGW